VRERIVTFVSESRLPCERFSLQRSVQRLCFRTLARVATTITSLTEPQPCRRLERSGSGAHPVATKHFCLAAFTTGSEKVMRSGGGLGESAMGRIHGSFTYTGSSQQVGLVSRRRAAVVGIRQALPILGVGVTGTRLRNHPRACVVATADFRNSRFPQSMALL
jgi:hypothetical protein